MKAVILTANGVEDLEFFYPYYRMREQGIETDVATPGGGTVVGKNGYEIKGDISLEEISAEDYDLLILPGGKSPETVRLIPAARQMTQEMMNSGKIVASICHGAQILISADVLQGRQATCWEGIRDDVIAAGGNYRDEPVVVDGNLITSRQPDDLPMFCREIFLNIHSGVMHG